MAFKTERVPSYIEKELKKSLSSKDRWGAILFQVSYVEGRIGDIVIGVCCCQNSIQDEHGVPPMPGSVTDYDPSVCFYFFAYRDRKLLWCHPLEQYEIELQDNCIELHTAYGESLSEKVQNARNRTRYLDPVTGRDVEKPC